MSVSAPTSDIRVDQAAPAAVAHNAPQTDMPAPRRAAALRDTIEQREPIVIEDAADAPRFCACLDGWLPACVVSFIETVCSWVNNFITAICGHAEREDVREEEPIADPHPVESAIAFAASWRRMAEL